MANQFSRPDVYNDLKYSPENFKDMAIAPLAMRDRHDKALQFQDDLLFQMQNIKVADNPEIQAEFARRKSDIEENINNITNRINTSGAGSRVIMGDLRGLKRDYNKEVSATGFTGKAAAMRSQIDKERDLLMAENIRKGFNPLAGEQNYKMQLDKYMEGINVDLLSDESKGVSDFKASHAPNKADALSMMKEGKELFGKLSNSKSWATSTPKIIDGQLTYVDSSGREIDETNEPNLAAYKKFMNTKVLNPDSELRQSLRWANPNKSDEELISEFGIDADLLEKTATITSKAEESSFGQRIVPVKDKSGVDDEKPTTATLVDTDTGAEVVKNLGVANILSGSEIADIELAEENGTVTPEQINRKKLLMQTRFLVQEQVNDPKNKAAINANLAKNSTLYKVLPDGKKEKSDIEGYNKEINKLNEDISKVNKENNLQGSSIATESNIAASLAGGMEITQKQMKAYEERNKLIQRRDVLKGTLEDSMEGIISPEALKYSKMYNVTGLKDGNDLNAETIKDLNYRLPSMLTLAANSGATFTVDGSTGDLLNFNDNKDKFDEAREGITNGGGKIDTFDIIDMGSTGASQLVMHYSFDKKNGTGSKGGMIAINFDDKVASDSSIMQFMTGLQSRLDPKGQAVIQTVLDNKATAGLSIDNTDFATAGMSGSQSKKIKELNKAFSNPLEQNYDAYKKANYINTDKDNNELYNIVQDKEGYNSLYVSRSGYKDKAVPLAVGTWLRREFVKDYLSKNPNVNDNNSYTDISKASDEKSVREFVSWGKDFAETQTAPGGIIRLGIPGNNSTYETTRKEYISALQKATSLTKQKELTDSYLEEIKALRISTRNKKRLL